MLDTREWPEFRRAVEQSNRKMTSWEYVQSLAILAVAEAIHRVAAAVEDRETGGDASSKQLPQ